jgi:hypothetical protein
MTVTTTIGSRLPRQIETATERLRCYSTFWLGLPHGELAKKANKTQ